MADVFGWAAKAGIAGTCLYLISDCNPQQDKLARLDDEVYQAVDRTITKQVIKIHGIPPKGKGYTGYILKSDYDSLNIGTVSIPASFAGLEAEMIPTRLQDQLFRIVEVVEDEDYVEVTARHVWYDNLKNYTLWEPAKDAEYTAAAVCRNILINAISDTGSHVASDCTDKKLGSELDYKNKNLVEAFLDPENGVCAKFGLSLIRNNWDFYCLKEVGYNRGFIVETGKNLLGVERTESIENLATRVAPIGKTSKGDIVWLDYNGLKYIDSQYIDDYSCPMVEIYDSGLQIGKDGVTSQNIQDKLLEAAQKRFSEDHVDIPEVEMTIEFLSLGDTEEYAQYRGLDKVYLYDIITVHDTVRGYDYTAQVVGVEHDVLTGMLTSVTIGKLNNWDGTRKIATWQVPEVNGENIRLKTIMAGSFADGAIQGDDIAVGGVNWVHLNAASITQLTTEQLEALTANIHTLIAGTIAADDIIAGSITTAKLAAGAVTTDKLDALAVTTDKLAANSINADKIDTQAISAIRAKLGVADIDIANIANAQINTADINFAHIKDLSAGSAYFGQTVFQEAVGGKLYVPRLAVGYAQMLGATISDLVIQASNDNFYKLDVDLAGNVTATQMTPTAEEIAQGYTDDGRTIYMGTDILATDLNTQNIYASHGLMDQITANIINVDKLFAREATITKINAMDLSSNTYIQSVVGDWVSGSTITQTINSINTRITSLGYGTFYYSATEPSHNNLVAGDVWIKPIDDNTWGDISELTWGEVSTMTWDQVLGIYEMYVWTGTRFKLLYDSKISANLQTQINQNAYAITLKADESEVDLLSNQVTEFAGTLEVQSQQITAAVSAVNAKTANYVQATDPSLDSSITLHPGDQWTKAIGNGTWRGISSTKWRAVSAYTWGDIAGSKVYTWDGTQWIQTTDRAVEKVTLNQITITDEAIQLLSSEQAIIGDQVSRNTASITVMSNEIRQEVARATAAEAGKIAKTTQYQTADEIVSEAVSQAASGAAGIYLAKTSSYQTADSIVTEAVRQAGVNAGNSYIAKTSSYQTADAIKNEAVRVAGNNAANTYIAKSGAYTSVDSIISQAETLADNAATTAKNASIAKTSSYQSAQAIVDTAVATAASSAGSTYIAKTSSYQTADAIVNAAESYVDTELTNYSTTTQTSTMISTYVGNNAYGKVSGITITANGIDISGSQYVQIASGGYFRVTSGTFGIMSDAGSSEYAIWSGANTAASSPYRVKKDGTVYLTKLVALDEQNQESEVNLRTTGLWKLNYATIKSLTVSGGYCTSITLSNAINQVQTINFKSAASLVMTGAWGGTSTFTVSNNLNSQTVTTTITRDRTDANIKAQFSVYDSTTVLIRDEARNKTIDTITIDASYAYKRGWNGARDAQTVVGTVYTITAHSGDWVKVQEVGTGYSRVPYQQ